MPTAFLDHPRPMAFAHRGGAAHAPENSWQAFEHALGLGYWYLETDLQATADGVLIAFHDRTLDRVTDRGGRIARLPYRTVAEARIAGTEPIPRLDDLLAAWPDVRFNIDLKDAPVIEPLAERAAPHRIVGPGVRDLVLGQPGCAPRGGCWTGRSAWPPPRFGISMVRFGGPRGPRDQRGPARAARRPAPAPAVRTWPWPSGWPGPGCAAPRCRPAVATPAFVGRAHALGLQVHAWTVNQPAVMGRLLDIGVDGIMTDQTVALRDVLISRGQWHPRPG